MQSATRTTKAEDEAFREWDTARVLQWLESNNFGEYKESFSKHQITGDLLPDLNYTTLKEIGVLIVGDRARIMQAIKKLQPKPPSKPHRSKQGSDQEEYGRKRSNDSPSNQSTPTTTPKMQRKPMVSFQSIQRDNITTVPLRDNSGTSSSNYQSQYRNQPFRAQRGGMKPLVIFPRTSSMKDKPAKSTQQDLTEAFDSVFGSASNSAISPNPSSASNYTNPGSLAPPTPTDTNSPRSPVELKLEKPEKDIMNMRSVREVSVY
jgi:hypothetical protein